MSKWPLVLFLGLILSSVFILMSVGVGERVIPIIKFSEIENEKKIGKLLAERLYYELTVNDLVFWGLDKNYDKQQSILSSFLKRSKAEGVNFLVVLDSRVAKMGFDPQVEHKKLDLQNITELDYIHKAVKAKTKLVVISTPLFVSKKIPQSLTNYFEKSGVKAISFAFLSLENDEKKISNLSPPCVMTEDGAYLSSAGLIGCELLKKNRRFLKSKKINLSKMIFSVDQVANNDLLIYTSF